MKKHQKVVIMAGCLFLSIYGCLLKEKPMYNGFTYPRPKEKAVMTAFGVDSVLLISRVSLQGYFIGFESENGREIHLFIEGKEIKAPDFKRIITSLEFNQPSTWNFYYCPWGGNDAAKFFNYIDSTGKCIRLCSGFDVGLTSSYLSPGTEVSMKRIKRYGYKIAYMYAANTCFRIGATSIKKLNQANSGQRWFWDGRKSRFSKEWTGPKTNQPCYYFIDTQTDSMRLLLPCSITEAKKSNSPCY